MAAAVALTVLAGCAITDGDGGSGTDSIIVGTTTKVVALDPAGAFDAGSLALQAQVFAQLLTTVPGSNGPTSDLAASASFTSSSDFTVKLKPGLKFANGHALTASDVKFSFDRQQAIKDPHGPSVLLHNLASTEVVDASTVVFHLLVPNDQTFAAVLTSQAGFVVDEQVFSPTGLTADGDIVRAKAFNGQYLITQYDSNNLVSLARNDNYAGALGSAKTGNVDVKFYTDSAALRADMEHGNVEVAYGPLTPADLTNLGATRQFTFTRGSTGEARYLVFNLNSQPFGATTASPDAAKARAVRQAVAALIDTQAIADQVFGGGYEPLTSPIPTSTLTPSDSPTTAAGGTVSSGLAARGLLAEAGISTPVPITLQFDPDQYGQNSAELFAALKAQLESRGLFTVTVQSTPWMQYGQDRAADSYPAFEFGWFPAYPDVDAYLTPLFGSGGVLGNHYANPLLTELVSQQAVEADQSKRQSEIAQIQAILANDVPVVPLIQATALVVSSRSLGGAALDGSATLRLGGLYLG
jgi:peptide/nickel transport system substrate-binding protein